MPDLWAFCVHLFRNGTQVWEFSIPEGRMTSDALIVDHDGTPVHSGSSGAAF